MKNGTRAAARSPRRRRWILGVGAALAVMALVVVGAVLAGHSSTGSAEAGATASATTPSGVAASVSIPPPLPTPSPTGETSDADSLPPSLHAVELGEPAAVGNGITGTVVSLEAIEGTGHGPGNIAGPAVRATIRITNGTKEPVSLDAVAVDMTYGSDRTPASPLDDPSERPFSGMVQPGGSGQGVYVFTVPAAQRSAVTLSVGYQAGAPFMVFTGSAR